MNETIKAVRNGELYPRTIIDILHGIIYDGKTWENYKTAPNEILKVFNYAWNNYSAPCQIEDANFNHWVVADMKSHVAQAEKICPYIEVEVSEVEETDNGVTPLKRAA